MGVQLVDHTQVLDRLNRMQGVGDPSKLTQPILDHYIEAATGRILIAMGLSVLPARESLSRNQAEGLCIEIVLYQVRKDFFGLDAPTMTALSSQIDKVLAELVEAAADEEEDDEDTVIMRVVGGRNQ